MTEREVEDLFFLFFKYLKPESRQEAAAGGQWSPALVEQMRGELEAVCERAGLHNGSVAPFGGGRNLRIGPHEAYTVYALVYQQSEIAPAAATVYIWHENPPGFYSVIATADVLREGGLAFYLSTGEPAPVRVEIVARGLVLEYVAAIAAAKG